MRLRASILQQSVEAIREKYGGEQRDGGSGTRPDGPMDWAAMFEGRDRAGIGRAKKEDVKTVLEEVRVGCSCKSTAGESHGANVWCSAGEKKAIKCSEKGHI